MADKMKIHTHRHRNIHAHTNIFIWWHTYKYMRTNRHINTHAYIRLWVRVFYVKSFRIRSSKCSTHNIIIALAIWSVLRISIYETEKYATVADILLIMRGSNMSTTEYDLEIIMYDLIIFVFYSNFNEIISLKFFFLRSILLKSELVQVMAWCRIGAKQLP